MLCFGILVEYDLENFIIPAYRNLTYCGTFK